MQCKMCLATYTQVEKELICPECAQEAYDFVQYWEEDKEDEFLAELGLI